MDHLFLYVIVFVSGAAVLAIEILGTRILGPFYGVSLFLWSALITVTLVALSAGYAIGGRWADKQARLPRLYYLLAGAGLWMLLIPWLTHPVLMFSEPLGLRFAVLAAAFILFAPPLTLLGMVSPYAIRVRASSLNIVGRTVGDLYAISTVGSVISALLTGFVFIPNFGVSRLTIAIGLALLVLTLLGSVVHLRSKLMSFISVLAVGAAVLAMTQNSGPSADAESGLLAVRTSPYAELRVVDTEVGRHLVIDGGIHTIVDRVTYQSVFPYVDVMDLPRLFFEKRGRLLLIGLGGGSVAKNYALAGWEIDAVEIDPVVADLAYEHFGLDSAEARVFITDGRKFLNSSDAAYDLIIVDAFGSSSIPFHLVTRESFALMKSRLHPDGVLALNFESVGWHSRLVYSLAATLQSQFSEVSTLPMAEPPNRLGNIIMLAANRTLELREEMTPTEERFSRQYHRNHAWDNRFVPATGNAAILTDDLNPIDLWSEEINRVAREELHDYFGRGLSW